MCKLPIHKLLNIISAISLVLIILFVIYLKRKGILTSTVALKEYISGFGTVGAVFFIFIQVVQVVVPIIPGGISCLAGVMMFGNILGFAYNYIGICIGSVLAFFVSRIYGKKIMISFFGIDKIARYEKWTSDNNKFLKIFAAAIFLPIAPDDILCYVAGTTNMLFRHFLIIILLGKPAAILLYSLGLEKIFCAILG